jgi:S-adenosylmethionine-diacylgycerolhomoserine-N-methlytransferase
MASLEAAGDRYSLAALDRYYRLQARIYDCTRPLFLFGRRRLLAQLQVRSGELVVDVGCGTGWSFPHLAAADARVVGVEVAAAMRVRAHRRAESLWGTIGIDSRPYGTHAELAGRADVVQFVYSLTMIPPFEEVIARARADLRPGGRIGVVDFLGAVAPFPARALAASHVHLGPERLEALSRTFPSHHLDLRSAGLWRYFVFTARTPAA